MGPALTEVWDPFGVELDIKPWGIVSTESPLPMGFREGLKVGLGRGRQVANTCQSQHA